MKSNEDAVLAKIGMSEGGYVNHPKDPGGATDRGITQSTYDAWNKEHGRAVKSVRGISKQEAEEIIVGQYFRPVRFDDLPGGLDYAVVDYAVNSGPSQAVKSLQRLVGAEPDGIMGAKTLAAVDRHEVTVLINRYQDARLAFMQSLKTWATFGNGWKKRVAQVRRDALAMAVGREAPAFIIEAPAKAIAGDEKATSVISRVLSDPVASAAAAAPILTPLVDGEGPVSWAVAAVVVLLAVWALYRVVKK